MNIHAAGEAVRRREEILRIVLESAIHSQDELLALLRGRGFTVTQPTLSRDLRELGMAKSAAGYVAPGTVAAGNVAAFVPRESLEERFTRAVRESVVSAQAAGNLVIVRTPVAAAQPVASAIDAASFPDVVGTIGGDDTIFVAVTTPSAAAALVHRIHEITGVPIPRHA
jgi:transcriptional regulator of arginine metabolism